MCTAGMFIAVLLYDAAYVTVRDLELTNRADDVIGEQYSQPDKLERTGVAVVAKTRARAAASHCKTC